MPPKKAFLQETPGDDSREYVGWVVPRYFGARLSACAMLCQTWSHFDVKIYDRPGSRRMRPPFLFVSVFLLKDDK